MATKQKFLDETDISKKANDNASKNFKLPPIGIGKNFKKIRNANQIDEIWKSIKNVPNNAKWVYSLLLIGAFTALALFIIGIVLNSKVSCSMSKIILAISSISLVTFLWGLYSTWKYNILAVEYLENESSVNPEDIDQAPERVYLNVLLFLTMFLFICFALFSFTSVANKERIMLYIKAKSINEDLDPNIR